jgi:hypothetical protein
MLFKNHQKVKLSEEPLYLKVKEEFEGFLKGKKNIVFRTHDKPIINPTGYTEYDRTQTIPTQITSKNAEGDDNDFWVYCEKPPKILQNGEKEYDTTPIFITRELTVDTADKDKVFFLMFLCTAAKNGRIFVVNELKEADQRATEMAKNSRIVFMLMDDLSPVQEPTMRRIAQAFGVSNVDKMTKAQVALRLKDIIEIADKTFDTFRNSDAFIKAIDMDESTNTRALVQEAIDAGKIKFDEVESVWYYANEEGIRIKKIIQVDLGDAMSSIKRTNELFKHFTATPDRKNELLRLLKYQVDEIEFDKVDYGVLKKWLPTVGESGKGTHDELIERATKFYIENKDKRPIDVSLLLVAGKTE